MKYFTLIAIIIAVAVTALFVIKDNDALLLLAIATVIASFWKAVLSIPQEEEEEETTKEA